MRTLRRLIVRLVSPIVRERDEARLREEVEEHLAQQTAANMRAGMTSVEARRQAILKFGAVEAIKDNYRERRDIALLEHVLQDSRYAIRGLRRNPGFAIVAVLTLAFGIGLTTAVFSVVHAVLLNPLPYTDSDRIVLVRETFRDLNRGNASVGHFHDWTEHNTVFEHTAAGQSVTYNLADGGDPERVRGMRVTPGYFQVAHMPPAIGRYFTSADVQAGGRVVVMSHSLWQIRFAGDRSILGRQIRLGGEAFTVVGVAPAAYALTDPARIGVVGGFSAQLWTPLTFPADQRAHFGSHYLGVVAKLKPGGTLDRAQADLERVTRGIAERHPKEMEARGVVVLSLKEELVGNVRSELVVLLAAVGFVLLICCVNIASLLTARATARRREVSIRAAIGGDRPRIVRQLLTESAVLALAGGLASLAVARLGIDFLVTSGPEALPRLQEAGMQMNVLLFALAVTGSAAVISGLAPAIRASRVDLQGSLRDGGRTALDRSARDRMRTALVVAEIAIAAVLLVGTGLLVRSAEKLRHVPLGFDAHDTVTARVTLPVVRYSDDRTVADAYRRILEPLRGARGISHSAAATNIPLMGSNADAATVAEGKPQPLSGAPSPAIRLVTDQYFEAIGMTLANGRSFQSTDMVVGTQRVVVINERLASALWPGEKAIGKRLSTWAGPDDPEWREVVGVVRDTRSSGQHVSAPMELFIPYTQAPFGGWNAFQRSMVLVVRTNAGWPDTYVPLMRRAVRDVDASVPIYDVRTLESVVAGVTANRRFYMRMVLVLAATGLGLAMLGIYGVIAYFVTARTPEIGLRLALGAERAEVIRMVIGHGLRTALVGIAVGVPAALMLTSVMTGLLYEVAPTDPMTFVAVAVLLVVTSLIAAAIPSARAACVDPLVALKCE